MTLGELTIEALKLYLSGKTMLSAVRNLSSNGSISEVKVMPSNKPMRLTTHTVYSLEGRVQHILRLTRSGRDDPRIRKAVAKIIGRKCGDKWCVPEKDWESECREVFKWVKRNVRYTRDIEGKDTFQHPIRTIELGIADCDDMSSLIGSMLLAAGYPVKLRVIRTVGSKDWNHIFPMIGLPPGAPNRWVALDATVPRPMGWHPPANMIEDTQDFAA